MNKPKPLLSTNIIRLAGKSFDSRSEEHTVGFSGFAELITMANKEIFMADLRLLLFLDAN